MFENSILITISATTLLAIPIASVLASVLTYQSDERPTEPMPIDEYEKTKQSPWVPFLFGVGAAYAICAVASFISLTVLSYVLFVMPLVGGVIGTVFARAFSKQKSGDVVHAITVGCVAGYVGMIASVILGSIGLNGHL